MKTLSDTTERRGLKHTILGLALGAAAFGLAACGEPPDDGGAPPPAPGDQGAAPPAPPPN